MNDRRVLIACLVLLLVACLILSCAGIIGGGIYFWNSNPIEESAEPSDSNLDEDAKPETFTESAPTEATEKPESDATNPISTGTEIDLETSQQMDEIQMQVILDRGLKPSEAVNRGIYTPEQLGEKVIQDFEENYSPEEAGIDAVVLSSFGLLNPDFDLYTFYIDLLSEQIAGFYDQETKEMVIVQGEKFGGPERLTYAHEYAHALQDQNYDIENGLNYNEDACETEAERCAAIQALVEGDASLAELNWFFANGTPEDQAEIMDFYNNFEMPIFDSAPEFITLDFTFPYQYGYTFVEYLFDIGGWGTVDRAYDELPLSTEQIIHPERYPDDKPIDVQLPELSEVLGTGWEEIDRNMMGEWYTYLILAKGLDQNSRLSESNAASAAEGWGGDAYVVYQHDDGNIVMVLHTTWDTSEDADEFTAAFRDYAEARFGASSTDTWQGEDGFHIFTQVNDTTTWILAPDENTAITVWQTIQR